MSYNTREDIHRTQFVAHTTETAVVANQDGVIEAFGGLIKDLANPIDPLDAVNKQYADSFRLVGDIKISAISNDHNYWLLCDGRSLDATLYSDLFSLIGHSFGGCGNRFHLPNCAGKVLGSIGEGDGLTNRSLGDMVGAENFTMTLNELPTHTHTYDMDHDGAHNHTGTSGSAGIHNHSINDSGHNHMVTDTGHTHGVTDPGHSHSQWTVNDDFNNSGGVGPSFAQDTAGIRTWSNINASTTGITLQSSTTGLSINNNTTGVTINNSSSHMHSISTDGSHNHTLTINNTGEGNAFSIMQPTIFIGNSFIWGGFVIHP